MYSNYSRVNQSVIVILTINTNHSAITKSLIIIYIGKQRVKRLNEKITIEIKRLASAYLQLTSGR